MEEEYICLNNDKFTLSKFLEDFSLLIGNEEECSKYVDVPCEYEIGVDTTLTENLDRIVIYNGKKLFTNYGRIFTLES